jgi:hypothetical protein
VERVEVQAERVLTKLFEGVGWKVDFEWTTSFSTNNLGLARRWWPEPSWQDRFGRVLSRFTRIAAPACVAASLVAISGCTGESVASAAPPAPAIRVS